MAQYMYYDDNEDGTVTLRLSIRGDEMTFVIPMSFDVMVDQFMMAAGGDGDDFRSLCETVSESLVIIPDEVEEM